MAFDLASAQPVTDAPKTKFDLASAQDIPAQTNAPQAPTAVDTLKSDVSKDAHDGGAVNGVIQSVVGAGDALLSTAESAVMKPVASLARMVTSNLTGPGVVDRTMDPKGAKTKDDAAMARGKHVEDFLMGLTAPKTQIGKDLQNVISEKTSPVTKPIADHIHDAIAKVTDDPAKQDAIKDILGTIAFAKLPGKAGEVGAIEQAAAKAQQAGYKVAVSKARPTLLNKVADKWANLGAQGKADAAMSDANQENTHGLIKDALGIHKDAALDVDALEEVRAEQGKAYADIKNIPVKTVRVDSDFRDALDTIDKDHTGGITDKSQSPVRALTKDLRAKKSFTVNEAIEEVKSLRKQSKGDYIKGDLQLADARMDAARAIDDQIGRHLSKMGNTPGAQSLKYRYAKARQVIAQTYAVQKAMNATTGVVDARKLGAQLQRDIAAGRKSPLSGNIRKVAEFGNTFKSVAKASNGDAHAGGLLGAGMTAAAVEGIGHLAGHDPSGLALSAALISKPVLRAILRSPKYQKTLGAARTASTAAKTSKAAALRGLTAEVLLNQEDNTNAQ